MKRHNYTILLGVFCYLVMALLPIWGLRGSEVSLLLPAGRQAGLLMNTLTLGVSVAVFCTVCGLLAALWLWNSRLRQSPLRWFFLLLAPLPHYIYAMSWMSLVRMAGRLFPLFLRIRYEGFWFSFIVQVMAFLPLCAALALLGLERQNRDSLEAGLLLRGTGRTIIRITLPGVMPMLLAGGGIVFVLSITDFSIPSLFQYPVYALEILSEYSATGDTSGAVSLAVPLFLLTIITLASTQSGLGSVTAPGKAAIHQRIAFPLWLKLCCVAGVVLCGLQITLPLCSLLLLAGGLQTFAESVALAAPEFANSLILSLIAAMIAVITAFAAAKAVARSGRIAAAPVWCALLLPLALPGALAGIGLLTAINGSTFYMLSGSLFLPGLGCAIRALPFAALILTGALRRMDQEQLDAATLFQKHGLHGMLRVRLPLFAPGIFAAAGTVFLLSMGEVSVCLLLCPPGRGTLSVKIYNYLHYGASETVAGFCLMLTALTVVATGATLLWTAGRRWEKRALR